MATVNQPTTQPQPQPQPVEVDEFTSLLQKEFKPGDDARKGRIEIAVQTLAQQALADAAIIGDDVFSTVDAMRSALDRKLSEQINAILHNKSFQQLEICLARAPLFGVQHVHRQRPQDQGHEHLQGGVPENVSSIP